MRLEDLKRYKIDVEDENGDLLPVSDGEFVYFEDVEKLVEFYEKCLTQVSDSGQFMLAKEPDQVICMDGQEIKDHAPELAKWLSNR